jgi:hypothetical protein
MKLGHVDDLGPVTRKCMASLQNGGGQCTHFHTPRILEHRESITLMGSRRQWYERNHAMFHTYE